MRISISVIIVAFKSRSFIACCLNSLHQAAKSYDTEIIVIDNASRDGVGDFIRKEYSDIRFFQNKENIGFGSACNQGAQIADGDHLVFLNPDTIVSHCFFDEMLSALEKFPNAGILSCVLYDGSGHVLPESARRVPTVISAIRKSLGKTNGRFQYYEPINTEKFQEIPVVSGAAMMIEKVKFENIGGFDKRFFMYAEDIDLSYRSEECGYKNYLIKSAPVIHLKGESTSKSGWEYNRYFYSTMATFVNKYRGTIYSNFEYYAVALATFLLGIISMVYHSIQRAKVGISDFILGVFICFGVQYGWSYIRYGVLDYFSYWDHLGSYMLYVGIWVIVMGLGGAYWRDRSRLSTLKYLFFGLLVSLVVYSLLPLEWRFSRVVVLFSGLIMLIIKYFKIGPEAVIGAGRIVYINDAKEEKEKEDIQAILGIHNKIEYVESTNIDTVELLANDHVFLKTDDSYDPVEMVLKLGDKLKYSFVNSNTRQIVSSHFASQRGDRYDHLSHHNLGKKTYIYQKRIVDFTCSLLLFIPLVLFQMIRIQNIKLERWIDVLKGRKTIVGYSESSNSGEHIILSTHLIPCYTKSDSPAVRQEKKMHYSLHYSIFDDVYYIVMNLRGLISAYTYGNIEE